MARKALQLFTIMIACSSPLAAQYVVGAYYHSVWFEDASPVLMATSAWHPCSDETGSQVECNWVEHLYCMEDAGHWTIPCQRSRDWWAGVRDFYADPSQPETYINPEGESALVESNTRAWNQPGQFPHLKPALGFYDESLTRSMERQILQAASHGISFFTFYWWWDAVAGAPHRGAESIDRFISAENSSSMSFMVAISAEPYCNIPEAQFGDAIDEIARFFDADNYLKVNVGGIDRPLLTFINRKGIGGTDPEHPGDWQTFSKFVKGLKIKVDPDPFVLIVTDADMHLGVKQVVDGYTCIAFAGNDPDGWWKQDYLEYVDNHIDAIQNNTDKPYLACLLADLNEKPRMDLKKFGDPNQDDFKYFDGWQYSDFTSGLSAIEESLANLPPPGSLSNMLVLYSWNEWLEGGHVLQPTYERPPFGNTTVDRDHMLDRVKEVFGLNAPTNWSPNNRCMECGECNPSCGCAYGTSDLALIDSGYEVTVRLSTGESFVDPNWAPALAQSTERHAAEVTGDGADDLVIVVPASGRVWVRETDEETGEFETPVLWCSACVHDERLFGDFDGDGMDDLGVVKQSEFLVWRSEEGGTTPGETWCEFCVKDTNARRVGDFNGDGRSDLVLFTNGVNSVRVEVLLSDGSTLDLGTDDWLDWDFDCEDPCTPFVGDFDGDGRDDLALHSGFDELRVHLSRGRGFSRMIDWTTNSEAPDYFVGDYNGDGRDDLGWVSAASLDFVTMLSSGASFIDQPAMSPEPTAGSTPFVGNFDGLDNEQWPGFWQSLPSCYSGE